MPRANFLEILQVKMFTFSLLKTQYIRNTLTYFIPNGIPLALRINTSNILHQNMNSSVITHEETKLTDE